MRATESAQSENARIFSRLFNEPGYSHDRKGAIRIRAAPRTISKNPRREMDHPFACSGFPSIPYTSSFVLRKLRTRRFRPIVPARAEFWVSSWLARLHQLNAIFAIFGASDRDKSLDLKGRGLRN